MIYSSNQKLIMVSTKNNLRIFQIVNVLMGAGVRKRVSFSTIATVLGGVEAGGSREK